MRPVLLPLALAACLTTAAHAQVPAAASAAALPAVVPNDNRYPSGTLRDGVAELRLVARFARWYPLGGTDSSVVTPTLGEESGPPRIPAPLVRVPVGTRVRLSVRNTLDDSLFVCVRGAMPCHSRDTLWLRPGESGALEVLASDTGMFAYYGALRRVVGGQRILLRPPLTGAFVVDGPRPRPDRIMVLNGWAKPRPGSVEGEAERFFIAINGLLWPRTERLTHTVGDTVRWRLLNATRDFHPMHLHGFYFQVNATGDGARWSALAPAERRLAVTENVPVLGTVSMEWVPVRAGNWLFHCHKALHVAADRRTDLRGGPRRLATSPPPPLARPVMAGASGAADPHAMHALHAEEGMAGMIVGITVRPRGGAADVSVPPASARQVRLLVQERPRTYGPHAALGYARHDDATPPAADSVELPARPLVLQRGEPVSITVVNRLAEVTGVHWHGIELESFFDGVGGWSGSGTRVAPMIAPGDSFVAHFTPPRAGTFMFHAHADEMRQLSSGLVAPLIVLEKGARWDPTRDHVLLVGQAGPDDTASVTVNGRASHLPMTLMAGVPHRFRVISMTPQDDIGVALLVNNAIGSWRAVAKDGADLPPGQAVTERAMRRFGPGETFDFEIVPEPGESQLVVRSFTNVMITLIAR